LIHGFVWAMPSRRINNFPESRRGLGHVTLKIFGSTVGYPSDSLASCFTYFPSLTNSLVIVSDSAVDSSWHRAGFSAAVHSSWNAIMSFHQLFISVNF